jgi:glycosyltransferase involved in cell wall biosynthesis
MFPVPRLRIAQFVQRYPPALGGSEAYFGRLSAYLHAQGHAVTVWTTTALDLEAFWAPTGRQTAVGTTCSDGVTVRRFAPLHWQGRRYVLKALTFVPDATVQALAMPCNPIAPAMWHAAGRVQERADVVHVSAFPYGWLLACGYRLARRQRARFAVTPFLHLGDPTAPDRTRRAYLAPHLTRYLHLADVVFAQTPSEHAAIVRLGVPAERVVLQGLGVAPSECTGGVRARARQTWGIRPGEVVVGHLANNSVEKGTVDLLQALLRVPTAVRVVLAGPDMANFRSFWASYPAPERVVRLGVLNDDERRDFYAGIDGFALPSRSDSFGLVLLEAWANGVPNVAYRAGGVADLIRDRVDGRLVPCGDVAELATALGELLDELTRQTWGQAGAARVAREFVWEQKLAIAAAGLVG